MHTEHTTSTPAPAVVRYLAYAPPDDWSVLFRDPAMLQRLLDAVPDDAEPRPELAETINGVRYELFVQPGTPMEHVHVAWDGWLTSQRELQRRLVDAPAE